MFQEPPVKAIRSWASQVLKVPEDTVEALQLVRYQKGEQYSTHVDWGRKQDASLWLGGQRTATALIYLNTLPKDCGGETSFERLGIQVSPQAGAALVWPNVDSSGRPQDLVEHRAMPVLCETQKYAVNVLSAGLGAYAAARDWQRAVQVLLEIQLLAPRAQAKHWLQDAQTTAMFAALQPSGWEQCMVLFQGHANLTSLGCAIRACGMGRYWLGALRLLDEGIDALKCERRALWSAAHLACQASEAPQPLSPELSQMALPL
ncbi:2-oxoglutarate-4-dioxygenase subunit alpha-1) [Durusdinium trenchii]|uniref:2-oxoglutarate-4-dioxygenase subunit alpha-1 n=1 Tax=Durusdinium trenchii TaxID=1381693 RepID=A0ABP0J3H7_9DINO